MTCRSRASAVSSPTLYLASSAMPPIVQQIIELVRDAAREPPHRIEAFAPVRSGVALHAAWSGGEEADDLVLVKQRGVHIDVHAMPWRWRNSN